VSAGDEHEAIQDFLAKMDAGDFDDDLHEELKKLSMEQREELARILIERNISRSKESE
jgi:hypothetical protein